MGGLRFARGCMLGVSAFLRSFDLLCFNCSGLILKLSLTQESRWVALLLNWKQPQQGEVWTSLSLSCPTLFQDTPPLSCSQSPDQAGWHPPKLYPDADRNRDLDTFQIDVHLVRASLSFFVASIRYPDKCNLREKGFIWVYCSRDDTVHQDRKRAR